MPPETTRKESKSNSPCFCSSRQLDFSRRHSRESPGLIADGATGVLARRAPGRHQRAINRDYNGLSSHAAMGSMPSPTRIMLVAATSFLLLGSYICRAQQANDTSQPAAEPV